MDTKTAFEQKYGKPPREAQLRDPYYIGELCRQYGELELDGEQRRQSEVQRVFPRIVDVGRDGVYYGGDQRWFGRKAQRQAGCAPTAAANMLAALAARDPDAAKKLGCVVPPDGRIEKDAYLRYMEDVYAVVRTYEIPLWREAVERIEGERTGVPGSLGRDAAGFERGVLKYAGQRGVPLTPHRLMTSYAGYEEGLRFIQKGLWSGCPVGLLTTWNRHPLRVYWRGYERPATAQKKGVRSHFMTITGLRPAARDKWDLLLSSWGMVCAVGYDELYKSWQQPLALGSMLAYFTRAGGGAPTGKYLLEAYTALPESLGKTVKGIVDAIVNKK